MFCELYGLKNYVAIFDLDYNPLHYSVLRALISHGALAVTSALIILITTYPRSRALVVPPPPYYLVQSTIARDSLGTPPHRALNVSSEW